MIVQDSEVFIFLQGLVSSMKQYRICIYIIYIFDDCHLALATIAVTVEGLMTRY